MSFYFSSVIKIEATDTHSVPNGDKKEVYRCVELGASIAKLMEMLNLCDLGKRQVGKKSREDKKGKKLPSGSFV